MRNPLPPLLAERLRALRERPIDPTEKGFGPLAAAAGGAAGGDVTAAGLAAARPGLHAAGFTYPLLTLRESALANNIEAMAAYCDRAGVALAPHGKTAMSPELAARQLAHGAWGITVATIGQLRTYRTFGFPRLLLANELVDEAGIAWLAGGPDAGSGDGLIVTAGGSAYFDVVTRELTAGGTAGMTVILRSGAYVTYDHGYYGTVSPGRRASAGSRDSWGSWGSRDAVDAPELRPALELWAQVLSRPAPGLALLGAGRRDVGFNKGLPVPLRAVRRGVASGISGEAPALGEVTELNDQHAYLRLDAATALAPGDLVCLGISHPCTTLDKWRVIPVVSDDGRVTDTVHAFF